MKTIYWFFAALMIWICGTAQAVQPDAIEGAWKIVQMGNMKESGEDLWEFQNGRFTQNLGGHRLASDGYQVNGNELDLGYAKLSVIELKGKTMKAEFGTVIYTLEKVSDKVVITPKPRKAVSKEAQQMAEDLAKAMASNVSESSALDCAKSVRNSHQSLDTMIGVGEKNYRDGYIGKDQYEQTSKQLRHISQSISVADCEGSSGNQRLFYTCMSNSNNLFIACAQKYK